jgi:triosephosphate isomerase (TIM)
MKDRKPLIAANWKMNLSLDEARDLLVSIKCGGIDFTKVDVLVAPPFTTLKLAHELLRDTDIIVAGQNMHWELNGAFTGEVSAPMLREAGCSHVILGHSERRILFNEASAIINRKVDTAIKAELIPVLCIGETLEEREDQRTFDIITNQLNESLKTGCQSGMLQKNLILAYEPVWAIGTGKTATPEQAQEVHFFIRKWLGKNFDPDTEGAIRILYGGSVKPDNIEVLMSQPDIDGVLVGGASLKSDSFLSIIGFYKN